MARVTGSTGEIWNAGGSTIINGYLFIDYSISQTDAQYNITTSAGVVLSRNGSGGAKFSMSGARTEAEKRVAFDGTNTTKIVFSSKTTTINKTKSTQAIEIKENVKIESGSIGAVHPSSAVLGVSIPAKPSYTIKYDANGGTGVPGNQTQWYGEDINLQAGKPTRTGYSFKCWNTKQDGTGTNYNPSQKYTANSALTLYAIWESLNKITVYDQNGNAHTGRLYIYDDNGNRHQCIISVYDENGDRKYSK